MQSLFVSLCIITQVWLKSKQCGTSAFRRGIESRLNEGKEVKTKRVAHVIIHKVKACYRWVDTDGHGCILDTVQFLFDKFVQSVVDRIHLVNCLFGKEQEEGSKVSTLETR